MFLLILESLGSTELVFILVMALVFFGPRKLPQISRTLGKSLADFQARFRRLQTTWDKEVTLEETGGATANSNQFLFPSRIRMQASKRPASAATSGHWSYRAGPRNCARGSQFGNPSCFGRSWFDVRSK